MPTDTNALPIEPTRPGIKDSIAVAAAVGLVAGAILAVSGFLMLKPAPPSAPTEQAETQTSPINHQPAPAENAAPKSVDADIVLGEAMRENGLHLLPEGDGPVTLAKIDGMDCVKLRDMPENYLYFSLAPELKTSATFDATIEVEFYAPRSGMFDVQYDGEKWGDRPESYYSDTPVGVRFDGWPRWHRVSLEITNARFQNRQNYGADFRLRVQCPEVYVSSVRLIGIKASARPRPVQ